MNLIIFAVSSILYILVGAVMFLKRGGGIFNYRDYLKKKGIWMPRNLILVAIEFIPINILYLWINSTALIPALYIALAFMIGYIAAWVFGWGSYFDIGTWTKEYINHREILSIDWILYKLYGPLWLPLSQTPLLNIPQSGVKLAFDLIVSPSGKLRPYEWRHKRDKLGMSLRGLMSIFLFGSIAAIKWYLFSISVFQIGLICALAIPMFATGFIYAYFNTQTAWKKIEDGSKDLNPTKKSEVATGGLLAALTVIAFII